MKCLHLDYVVKVICQQHNNEHPTNNEGTVHKLCASESHGLLAIVALQGEPLSIYGHLVGSCLSTCHAMRALAHKDQQASAVILYIGVLGCFKT